MGKEEKEGKERVIIGANCLNSGGHLGSGGANCQVSFLVGSGGLEKNMEVGTSIEVINDNLLLLKVVSQGEAILCHYLGF